MNLFNYLMAKKGHNTSVRDDLFAYLLGKRTSKEVKTATGTTISISDVTSEKVVSLTLSKESSQETTTGSNLFNIPNGTYTNTDTMTIEDNVGHFTVTANRTINVPTNFVLKVGTYTLFNGGHVYPYFTLKSNNTNIVALTSDDNGTKVFTIENDTTIDNVQIYQTTSIYASNDFIFQINSGENVLDFEPYTGGQASPSPEFPQEVKTVKGYRNLFDKDNVINAYLNNNGTTTSNNLFRVSDFIELNKSENYITIVGNAGRSEINCFYDEQKNFISNFNMSTNSSKTVEIPSNAYYVRTTVYCGNLDLYQLTEGTEELPYVPYGTNYVAITNTNGTDTNYYTIPLNGNEIAGIGDYKDELIVDKNGHCWLNKKTGKVVLDGSENFEAWGNFENKCSVKLSNISNLMNIASSSQLAILISNYFTRALSQGTLYDNDIEGIATTQGNLYFKINKTIVSTLAEFKTWLSTHNTDVYYVLATTELIDLNYTVDIRLFNGVNNISNSDDMDMTLKYY